MLHHVAGWPRAVAEAVRVLRPGGRLVGYDVLDTAPVRWAHRIGETGQITTFRAGQLETELVGLPVTEIRTCRTAGGNLVRFSAAKTAATGPARAGGQVGRQIRAGRDRSSDD
jgi:SAM-dependent methyltransferase